MPVPQTKRRLKGDVNVCICIGLYCVNIYIYMYIYIYKLRTYMFLHFPIHHPTWRILDPPTKCAAIINLFFQKKRSGNWSENSTKLLHACFLGIVKPASGKYHVFQDFCQKALPFSHLHFFGDLCQGVF